MKATTSRLYFSPIHGTMTEVSSPPQYARTTFSRAKFGPSADLTPAFQNRQAIPIVQRSICQTADLQRRAHASARACDPDMPRGCESMAPGTGVRSNVIGLSAKTKRTNIGVSILIGS